MQVVRLSALHRRLYPPGNSPGTHFCYRLYQFQDHSGSGWIISMKNPSDTVGNQTRDLPACSALLQPTAPPRAPPPQKKEYMELKTMRHCFMTMTLLYDYDTRYTGRVILIQRNISLVVGKKLKTEV